MVVSGAVGLYAQGLSALWRGDEEESKVLTKEALEAASFRIDLKRQVEKSLLGKELASEEREKTWKQGKKAAVLGRTLDKMLIAAMETGQD